MIDLSIKYDLNSEDMSKLVDMAYQAGIRELESVEFQRIASYLCDMKMINDPAEEVIEELKRKGFIKE